jgi:hypothetical protein
MLRKQDELADKTQTVLRGSLKHARAAVSAALLLACAAVLATTVVASSQCEGPCPPPDTPPPCGFVTSGGFVFNDAGKEVNFGAHGGCKNGEFWGNVNLVDHSTGYHLNALDVTGFFNPTGDPNVRDICGSATTNTAEPQPVYFHIRLTDNGEPGVADTFGIRTSNGYVLSPRLLAAGRKGGGNVQLHEPNPSTASPNPMPDEATMCNDVAAP